MPTIKVIEPVGASPESWHAAVEEGSKDASRTLHGITGIDVVSTAAEVKDDTIAARTPRTSRSHSSWRRRSAGAPA